MARLLLALLCGSAALWAAEGERPSGKCGVPMRIANAEPEDSGSMRLRYTCVAGYKRKAGHSSLIVCKLNEKTKKFEWESNLHCIRDPSKPELAHTTEDARRDTETPTPTGQPGPPKTSANPAVVSGNPHGDKTTWPPEPSAATTLLPMAKSFPEEPTSVDGPQETGGGVSGASGGNVTPREETSTQDSRPESSKPSVRSKLSTDVRTTTAVSSRSAPENTTGVSEADTPQRNTGVSQLQAVLYPIAFVLLFATGVSWYCYRRHRRFRRQGDAVMEDIPVAERSEEGGWMLSAGGDSAEGPPAEEETPMRPSDCATSTG